MFGVYLKKGWILNYVLDSFRKRFVYEINEEFSRSELSFWYEWEKFQQVIGLSRKAIRVASYDNSILFGDVTGSFAQKLLHISDKLDLTHAMLEIRVGRKKYDIQKRERGVEKKYCNKVGKLIWKVFS